MFYKIGEFSKLVGISVKTLRYYDECGVLKPSKIDTFTGCRGVSFRLFLTNRIRCRGGNTSC